jgi:hypothetical protein
MAMLLFAIRRPRHVAAILAALALLGRVGLAQGPGLLALPRQGRRRRLRHGG